MKGLQQRLEDEERLKLEERARAGEAEKNARELAGQLERSRAAHRIVEGDLVRVGNREKAVLRGVSRASAYKRVVGDTPVSEAEKRFRGVRGRRSEVPVRTPDRGRGGAR